MHVPIFNVKFSQCCIFEHKAQTVKDSQWPWTISKEKKLPGFVNGLKPIGPTDFKMLK